MATDKTKNEKELTVEERLKALYELQTLLSEIDRIKTIRGELPLEVKDLEDEIVGLGTRIENINAEIKSVREEIMTEGDAFVESIEAATGFEVDWSSALKRMPQGWSAEDEYSDYYRLRNFLLVKLVDKEYFLRPDAIQQAAKDMQCTRPFNDTLNRAIEYAREMGW